MKTYLLNVWDRLRSSYWFVPVVFAIGSILLSMSIPLLDEATLEANRQLPEWILTTTDAARSTLSALVGSMLAVTSTVFSITIVVLSLTSQQFGPRLLRRFMYDLPTQLTLGVFLATGIYCLLLLRVVEHRDDGLVAPHLSVLVAIMLAMLSISMLIVFIHHVAMMIQAPHVVATVARDLDDAIERLYPAKIGEPPGDDQNDDAAAHEQEARLSENYLVVHSTREGYIQAINGEGLMDVACEYDLVLRWRARPGYFMVRDAPLADVWHASDGPSSQLNAEKLTSQLNEKLIVGIRRTPRQDVECAINELVEVAVRALSPGVNDPFTAMNCVDRLGASLGRLAEKQRPSRYRSDKDGCLRVIAHPDSFGDALDAAFNQIRQYARDSVAVTIRLLEALASIAEHLYRQEDRDAVQRHAEMIARAAESLAEENDRLDVQAKHEQVIRLLDK